MAGFETTDSFKRIEKAISSLRSGSGVVVTDDAGRENEGDLIFPAETLSIEQMTKLIRYCSGIVCLCLTNEKADQLELPLMAKHNTNTQGTAFTVSIEAAEGVTTGVSAADRTATVRAASKDKAKPSDLRRPGHVFPLRAQDGGTLAREGHTEATVDLMKLSGLKPCGVLCELTNEDGTMSRLETVIKFAKEHNYPWLTVEDIVKYRRNTGY
ncbi:MAG: 3,4-dihydroxy-2-butanone-4-phosphate synthase [Sedimentisphaeraceae bacterium JB056]